MSKLLKFLGIQPTGEVIRLGRQLTAQELTFDMYRGFVAIRDLWTGKTQIWLRSFGGFYDSVAVFYPDERFDWKRFGKTWQVFTLSLSDKED